MSDSDVNRLRVALARISRFVDRQVTGDGMTRTQLSVLGTIARHKSMGMGELAEIEGLNPTMLSRIVGKLEAAGLVARTPDADDRRSVIVVITAAGTRLHQRLRQQRTRLFADRLGDLDPDESATLLAAIPALESLAEALHPSATAGAGARR
jgi:DNA-binding MarR family transcriptional regulator